MKTARGPGSRQAETLSYRKQCLIACVLLSFLSAPITAAQPGAPESALNAAIRALNQGKFDQVEMLLRTSTDPRAIAVRARADIERGRYGEAEKALAPAAFEAPASDAALELGVLQF